MSTNTVPPCIGRYCGFPPEPSTDDVWQMDKCGPCPRGYRTNATKFCVKCEYPPTSYEWLYLGFMALLPCMLHWIFILRNRNSPKLMGVQLISSFVECVCSALLALISIEPQGELSLVTCDVERLSDWYTMFFNPQIHYTQTIHCTQEAVYPLITIICIYFAYTLVLMLTFRPIFLSPFSSKKWRDPVYAALYFHPVLIFFHVVVGGLIYYAFAYISAIASVIALSAYFVWNSVESVSIFFRLDFGKNVLIISWHLLLLSYGVLAISGFTFYLLAMVPIPTIFYFLTVKFSDPDNVQSESR